jgi:hypothetical protein
MKVILFTLSILMCCVIILNSCQKCHECGNICKSCVLKDSADVVIASRTLCADSSNYGLKDSLAIRGYFCTDAPSTFVKSFCANNAAGDQFTTYYNKTQFNCKEK